MFVIPQLGMTSSREMAGQKADEFPLQPQRLSSTTSTPPAPPNETQHNSTTIQRPNCLKIDETTSHTTPSLKITQTQTMASTTAQRRLLQEYRALTNNPPEGITAGPVSEDDLLYWEALIQGPEGTPFEGGVFPAELKFPKDYPLAPPSMRFLGEVWHPNGLFSFLLYIPPPSLHISISGFGTNAYAVI
jgi:ubiquitin-conjugating enzyme E2 G2